MSDDDLLTATQAAKLVGVRRETIHFAANQHDGRLPVVWKEVELHPKPVLYVRRGDLLAWDAARPSWAKRRSREAQARHANGREANAE